MEKDPDLPRMVEGWLYWQGARWKPMDISDNVQWRFEPGWGWVVKWKGETWKPTRFFWFTKECEWHPYQWVRVA